MKLHILGSGSSGNSYIFQNDTEALCLEAGIRLSEVKKAVDFDINKIVGCLITHCHLDHAKHVRGFINAGIDCYSALETFEELGIVSHRAQIVFHNNLKQIGGFSVLPFSVKHDAPNPFGFLIKHPEMGTVLFMTDSYYCEYKFPGLNNLLIEANYSEDILIEREQSGSIHQSVARRVRSSHMELSTLKSMLTANDLTKVNQIVLIHLSDKNSDATRFQREITELTGKTVWIANKGMEIEFNKTPF